ncbi:MAG TPA: hypothetical protein VF906_00625 [Candidatus Bathyarchaeia archaeon]
MEDVDRDETLSWRAATVVMAFATLFTVATRLLSMDPFTIVFDIFIVYIPTNVLVGSQILLRRRPRGPTRE